MHDSIYPDLEPLRPPSGSLQSSDAYTSSPAALALMASRGRWKLYRLHAYLNRLALTLAAGSTRRLAINLPAQHGKSEIFSVWFPAWLLLTRPGVRIISLSYGDELATTWSRRVRAVVEEYGGLAGVALLPDSRRLDSFELTNGATYYAGSARGAVLGRPADFIILDDPIKADEALSEVVGDATWENYLATVRSRLSEHGAIVAIGTRFGEADFFGRVEAAEAGGAEKWERVILPALAEEGDPLGRAPGEALVPELKSKEFLEAVRATVGPWLWETAWQQHPTPKGGGGVFPVGRIKTAESVPATAMRARGWDLAASSMSGDYTVGIKLARWTNEYTFEDVVRIREGPGRRDEIILATARADGRHTAQVFEEQPGEAGKSEKEHLQRLLRGYWVVFRRPLGTKEFRCGPLASAMHAGSVSTVEAPWRRELEHELQSFPGGRHDDQCDAAALAYAFLVERRYRTVEVNPEHRRPITDPERLLAMGIHPGDAYFERRDRGPTTPYAPGTAWDAVRVSSPFGGRRGHRRMGP